MQSCGGWGFRGPGLRVFLVWGLVNGVLHYGFGVGVGAEDPSSTKVPYNMVLTLNSGFKALYLKV